MENLPFCGRAMSQRRSLPMSSGRPGIHLMAVSQFV